MPKNFPTATSIRLIYLFWSFTCLLIGTAYSTFLYSIMTIPSGNPTINTVEQLARAQFDGVIKVAGLEDSSYYQDFKVSIII